MLSSSSSTNSDLVGPGVRKSESSKSWCGESRRFIRNDDDDLQLLDVTCTSEESFSFSLPDVSSVCEDHCETSTTQLNTTADVVFPNYLLCFVEQQERELQELQQRAASSATSIAQLHLQRQLLQAQRRQQQDLYDKLVWQPGRTTGLCCHPQSSLSNLEEEEEAEQDDHDICLFEQESQFLDDDDDDDDDDDYDLHDEQEVELHKLEKDRTLSVAGNGVSSPHFDLLEEIPNLGGTVDDPRYVPRPSTTTPSLREFVRATSSRDEGEKIQGKQLRWQNQKQGGNVRYELSEAPTKNGLGSTVRHSKYSSSLQSRLLHRRTRSEEQRVENSDSSITGASQTSASSVVGTRAEPLLRSRTAGPMSISCPSLGSSAPVDGEGSANKKGGKKTVMNLLRRTRLPSLRKQTKTDQTALKKHKTPDTTNADAAADDVGEILASLELSLKTRSQEVNQVTRTQHPRGADSLQSPKKKPFSQQQEKKTPPSNTGQDSPSVQQSGITEDTQSDTSSLDDVFSGVLSDSMEDEAETNSHFTRSSTSSSESSSDDSRSTVDRFLSSPYSTKSHQKLWSSSSESTRPIGVSQRSHHPYRPGSSNGRRAMGSASRRLLPSEFIRCGSVDTTKASNLGGLGADRARLLDLQAVVWQQQQQELDRLSAPPLDFETPDGDGVIRVQEAVCGTIDAACEIEVLPKNFLLRTPKESLTAAEF